jgi:hypothetical protein
MWKGGISRHQFRAEITRKMVTSSRDFGREFREPDLSRAHLSTIVVHSLAAGLKQTLMAT